MNTHACSQFVSVNVANHPHVLVLPQREQPEDKQQLLTSSLTVYSSHPLSLSFSSSLSQPFLILPFFQLYCHSPHSFPAPVLLNPLYLSPVGAVLIFTRSLLSYLHISSFTHTPSLLHLAEFFSFSRMPMHIFLNLYVFLSMIFPSPVISGRHKQPISIFIHASIFYIHSNPVYDHRRVGAYPSCHQARGGVCPGQAASPSQDHAETKETDDHACSHFKITYICIFFLPGTFVFNLPVYFSVTLLKTPYAVSPPH